MCAAIRNLKVPRFRASFEYIRPSQQAAPPTANEAPAGAAFEEPVICAIQTNVLDLLAAVIPASWVDVICSKTVSRADSAQSVTMALVDDPKAYTKPWTVTLKQRIVVDTELIDEICLENEKFLERIK